MRLFGIEPHPTIDRTDLLTYVCSRCDGVQTEIVAPTKLKPIGALLREKAFDAETTGLLGSAFDAAWERVAATKILPADKGHLALMRESLAKFIIAAVDQGERDPNRLVEKALLRLKIVLRRDNGLGAKLRSFVWKLRADTENSRKRVIGLARQMVSETHRATLIEMANLWRRLAEEAESKAF